MKNCLVVVDHADHAKALVEKSLRVGFDSLSVLILENTESKDAGKAIKSSVDSALEKEGGVSVEVEIIASTYSDEKGKIEKVLEMVSDKKTDAIAIHRHNRTNESYDYLLEKALLRGVTSVSLYLFGDRAWKSKMHVLCAVDVDEKSTDQHQLNVSVCNLSDQVAGRLEAHLHAATVIGVSRVSQELDIIEPEEVLYKKGAQVKSDLDDFISTAGLSNDCSTHVFAGEPCKEIPSAAKKLKTDLLLMGNVGRTGLKGLIVGNTAEKILKRLVVDVVVVKA